jgi:hypothetical protein
MFVSTYDWAHALWAQFSASRRMRSGNQRGSPTVNPVNGVSWNPSDMDYIRLALTAPHL